METAEETHMLVQSKPWVYDQNWVCSPCGLEKSIEFPAVQKVKNIHERHISAQYRPEPLQECYEDFAGQQRSLGVAIEGTRGWAVDKGICDKSATSRDWLAWWIHKQIRHRLPKCHYANVKLNPLVYISSLHKAHFAILFSRNFLASNESKQRNKTSQIKSKRRYQVDSSQKSSADRCSWALVNQSCLPCHLLSKAIQRSHRER